MRIFIRTQVPKNFKNVISKFDELLFRELKPPFVNLEIERFDGCRKDDEVHLKLKLWVFSSEWVSKIVENFESDSEFVFIDQGIKLPFPLKSWFHQHKVYRVNSSVSEVQDDIDFTSGNKLVDLFLYPTLFAVFYSRRFIYKKYF
ncbi:MAG: hypothetical protein H6622_08685 [Halobacteriovoraceae bacterium]|nr:hypothetical protein [Halobacteriovoraceae bacterium]